MMEWTSMIDINTLVFSVLFLAWMASIIAGLFYPPKNQKDVYVKVALVFLPIIVFVVFSKIFQ